MKPTTITPGQIFFRQRNNSSVEFALVLDVRGSEVIYTSIGSTTVQGTVTAGSKDVKPNPEDRIIKMFNAKDQFIYNEFMGCIFGGNLDLEKGPFVPYYQLFTDEIITLHDND